MKTHLKSASILGFCFLCSWSLLPGFAQEVSLRSQSPELSISPDIQGQERDAMKTYLSSLPAQDRQNTILYAQDGNIYVNKPELRAQASPLIQVQGNVYQDRTGSLFSVPAYSPKPTQNLDLNDPLPLRRGERPNVWKPLPYAGSGPYRQIYSKVPPDDNTPGFSYEDATIYLPSSHRVQDVMRSPGHYRYKNPEIHENPKTQDTAYIYMGGWSASATFKPTTPTADNPIRTTSFATDAGYQYDKIRHGNYFESWVMSVGPEAGIYGPGDNSAAEYPRAFRLVAGQSPFFTAFYVSNNTDAYGAHTYLNLRATGAYALDFVTGDSIGRGTWTLSKEVTQASTGVIVDSNNQPFCPWNVNGNGMVLKRMTSIAQQTKNPNGKGNILRDDPTTCSYIKNAQWLNCHIGLSGQTATVQAWNAANYGGYFDYAFTPAIPNVISHTSGSGYDETDFVTIP